MNAVSGLLTPASPVLADGGSLDKTKPGLVAFLIMLALGVALWALLKNMGKQLGRAKDHFEAEDAALAARHERCVRIAHQRPAGARRRRSLDKTKPGLVAFLIVLALGVALWALLKNMGKQLGRAKDHFEAEDAALAAQAAAAVGDGRDRRGGGRGAEAGRAEGLGEGRHEGRRGRVAAGGPSWLRRDRAKPQ